jgi:alpha/beta superfamily hydrolase
MAGAAGRLEGILRFHSSAPSRTALLCHPHPLYRGSMHSPVLFRAARALHRRGFATLRFNFRGVGRSSGSFDSGEGEKQDVLTALGALREKFPGVPLTLLGYSFGSKVGFEAAAGDSRVGNLVGIGLPVTLWPFQFLRKIEKPLLVLQGSQDPFGSPLELGRLVEEIGGRARLVILPGADHSFASHLETLEETLYAEMEDKEFSG